MDVGLTGVLTTLLLLLYVLWFLAWRNDKKRSQLPPGPAPWPVLGNLWQKDILPLYRTYEKVREELAVLYLLPVPAGQPEKV